MFLQKYDQGKLLGFTYDNREPFDLFNRDIKLVRTLLDKVFQGHIIKYHGYKSLNDRHHQSLSFKENNYMVAKVCLTTYLMITKFEKLLYKQ